MTDKFNAKDALADYVTVPQRIAQFYELFGQGRLVTGEVRVELGPDGKSRVMVQAAAYRTPDDTLPGIGWSWMELPGTTSFTRGSELENTETSAWGRAIASLGILVDRSVASVNEIKAKEGEKPAPPPMPQSTEPTLLGPWSGAGKITVRKSGTADGALRQGPEGGYFMVAFDATDDKNIPQVLVRDPLAVDLLDAAGSNLNGLVCEIGGDLFAVPYEKDGYSRPFQRLHLAWIRTAGWSLPAPAVAESPLSGQAHAGAPSDEAELDLALELVP